MLTAMEEEGNSLVEVMRLLTDPEFQKQKIELIKDPMVKRYWTDEIANTSDFHKSEKLGYFVSKFDRFVTDTVMRNIIGQPYSAFDFRKVMDERKILLVNLSKGDIGDENSNFLGLILVPRILMAAMSRANVEESQRPDFYLYVDEFQNFATDAFAEILSEARKYHLNLIVANQFIGQIDPKIKDAVFGNVGTLVSFRIGQDDAEYLAHQFDPIFTDSDLTTITKGTAYTKLLVNGQPTVPFSLVTDWPAMQAVPRNPQNAQAIIEMSRQHYGINKEEVESEIKRRAQL
jgi:type IV secretory pathway TraG/TraD family ATPase VirD4